jgi:ribonuclease P protein component
MIPFINRFHGHSSLRYVYKNGEAIRSRLVTIKAIINPHRKASRIAVVISKKVLKSAVGRNRIRRRIYEYIRSQLPAIDGVYDIVIIVLSSEIISIPYDDMSDQISQLFDQSGIKRIK